MNHTALDHATQLRHQLVNQLRDQAVIRSDQVEHAMRSVPRHRFLPDTPVEDAYTDQPVVTKRDASGAALSSASQPGIVAMMLEQLRVQPGHRILEIGAGTGYNAGLLAYLTGPIGQVTTIDIAPDVTAAVRHALDTTGNRRVNVITRDGALGALEHGPYDRIIVTVGAWDIPPAWWNQLTPGGRLVVPLRWRGQTRSLALVHDSGVLRSDSVELCGFVPMTGQDGEHTASIDPAGHVNLHWDQDQPVNPATLTGVLDQAKTATWSGVPVVADEPFDGIWLRMAATDPGTCRIAAASAAVDAGLCTPAIPIRSPALVDGASLAYLAIRPLNPAPRGERTWELGAIGHGPHGEALAGRICNNIRVWDRGRTAQPVITVHRSGDSPADRPGTELDIPKPSGRLVIAYLNDAPEAPTDMTEKDIVEAAYALPDQFADRISTDNLANIQEYARVGEWGEEVDLLVACLIHARATITPDEHKTLTALQDALRLPRGPLHRLMRHP